VKVFFTSILLILFSGLLFSRSTTVFPYDSLTIDTTSGEKLNVTILGDQNTRVGNHAIAIEIRLKDSLNESIDSVLICVQNLGSSNSIIAPEHLITDSLGIAHMQLGPFNEPDTYTIQVSASKPLYSNGSADFSVTVRESKWVFMLLIGLFGGLSFFLYGMSLLSNGLQNSAGNSMRKILEKLTNNRFMAVGVGALITTIIQSSSATNVMLVSFVNSHLIRFRRTIGIILGAAIGTTITAQIIAFKLTDYSLIFVSFGLGMYYLSRKEKLSEVARAILGFGILFFGMQIMSDSMLPLRKYQPFLDILTNLENPLFGILVGAVFTALIQSSSAFIGILIVLSLQGILSLNASISLIIGANIGTSITAILASINTIREAKQVAFAHTLIKIAGAGIILIVLPFFTQIISHFNTSDFKDIATPRQIANAHTLYNILLFIIFIPFTKSIAALVNKVYPADEDTNEEFRLSFIDQSLLLTPDIALNAARKELIAMMQEVKEMFQLILPPFISRTTVDLFLIKRKEEKINRWRDEISEFLIQLSRSERSKKQIEETFILLNAVKEFEQIADVISSQLFVKAESWCSHSYEFSDSGKIELTEYHEMTLNIIHQSIKVYKDFNIKKAQKLKDKYYDYRDEYFELERQHYDRLKENIQATVSSSKTHLELITLFRVISSHATNTARTILYEKQEKKKVNDKH
jgi:phosphate:Na+ symporter